MAKLLEMQVMENLFAQYKLFNTDLNPIKWTKSVSPHKVNMKERARKEKSEEIH